MPALSAGKTGDPCVDDFHCSATTECCQIAVYCKGNVLTLQENCNLCPATCNTDSECSQGLVCENSQCIACPNGSVPDNMVALASQWLQSLRAEQPMQSGHQLRERSDLRGRSQLLTRLQSRSKLLLRQSMRASWMRSAENPSIVRSWVAPPAAFAKRALTL